MIAFESFVKSWPRFASAAPFLCLIVDHLLCPDTLLLSDELQKSCMDARIAGQLGMERGDEEAALAQQHRDAFVARQHLDLRSRVGDARRADEHAAERLRVSLEGDIGLEARV